MKKLIAKAGNVLIGGNHPIVVQTMCNTHTCDIEASYAQCVRMANAGAQLIRLTVQGMNEVAAIAQIRSKLRAEGIDTPLVADIHFRSDVALAVAPVVEKVRVNPGNFNKDHAKACEDFEKLIAICKEHGTAIRIGVNHGSLGERITSLCGNTPEGMAKAALEWLKMCVDNEFFNVVVSLKASNVLVMVQAYRHLAASFEELGYAFPLHLGVTEAGNGDAARIKSAVGIAALLKEGLGDTIRVSLTEDPVAEIPVGYHIANTCFPGRNGVDNGAIASMTAWEKHIIEQSCKWGPDLLDRRIDDFSICSDFGTEKDSYLKDEIMQACRRKFYRPEYVACPGCGRTMFNLEAVFEQVKKATSECSGNSGTSMDTGAGTSSRNVCIAVMGCIVNGPGEMADADFGYVGEGRGLVSIYKGSTPVYRHVPESEAIGLLVKLINM